MSRGVWCVWQLEDKREALAEFKDLSAAEPLRLIEKGGMSVLLALLRANDTQLTRDVLETLANLMDAEVPKGMAEAARVASVHNSGVFLTNGANVSLVLGSVDGEDGGHGTSLPLLVRSLALTRAMGPACHTTPRVLESAALSRDPAPPRRGGRHVRQVPRGDAAENPDPNPDPHPRPHPRPRPRPRTRANPNPHPDQVQLMMRLLAVTARNPNRNPNPDPNPDPNQSPNPSPPPPPPPPPPP